LELGKSIITVDLIREIKQLAPYENGENWYTYGAVGIGIGKINQLAQYKHGENYYPYGTGGIGIVQMNY
jgi:hypothetical protein